MKVRSLSNFATTSAGYVEGEVYEMPAEAARSFIASGHMEEVAAPKKAAAKKTAARKTAAAVETAATDL